MNTNIQNREHDIQQLNSFLRSELSSVETYGQCLDKVEDTMLSARLADLQESHRRRADLLAQKVRELGGEPEQSSGVWGGIAKAVTGGAKLLGDKATLASLEQGEDRGRDEYRNNLNELSPQCRQFVQAEILPEQLRTHDMMKAVRDTLH